MLNAGEGEIEPPGNQGSLFALVLSTGFEVDQFSAQFDYWPIIFKELGKVEGAPSFIALLIKVDGPNTVLVLIKIGAYLDDVIISAHVSEQAHKATFIEFDEFLGQSDRVQIGPVQVFAYKIISRQSNNMFLNKCILMDEEVDIIGRKKLFQFEAIDPRGIGLFYIKIIMIVIVLINNTHTHGLCVSKSTEINAVYVKVAQDGFIASRAKRDIDALESVIEFPAQVLLVDKGLPEGIFPFLIE